MQAFSAGCSNLFVFSEGSASKILACTHTYTDTHTVAINTHTNKRKMKLLQFPFTAPTESHQRNVLTFLVIIPGYAQTEVLTVVFWLDSKFYSAYLKKVLSGEKVILHSLSREPRHTLKAEWLQCSASEAAAFQRWGNNPVRPTPASGCALMGESNFKTAGWKMLWEFPE